MRDGPTATERIIGVVCLLLVAAITISFVAYAVRHREPFFSVDPTHEPAAIPPELKHARSLLPESPSPGWTRQDAVALTPDQAARALADDAEKFTKAGLKRLYEGRFISRLDSKQQLTVRVADMGTPEAAKVVFDAVKPATAVGEPVGVRGWRNGDAAVGFQSGRYFSLITANNVASGATLTPQLLAREVADRQIAYDASAPTAAKPDKNDKSAAAPAAALLPTVPGGEWSPAQGVATYNPGNLWEKIDGRAEQYLAFDFEQLVFGTYRLAADSASSIDCFIYKMRDPLKAYGIFQAERSGHPESIKLGKEGYRTKSSIFFIKGKAYVQLISGEDSKATPEQFLALANAIADSIPDEGGGNWAEALFPKKDLVEGSFSFQPKNAFSLDFLNDVFAAEYEANGAHLTLFIHQAPDEAAAKKTFELYADYVPKQGKIVERAASDGGETLIADFGGEYDMIFYKGRYFGGATSASDLSAAKSRIGELREALK